MSKISFSRRTQVEVGDGSTIVFEFDRRGGELDCVLEVEGDDTVRFDLTQPQDLFALRELWDAIGVAVRAAPEPGVAMYLNGRPQGAIKVDRAAVADLNELPTS